MQPLAIPFRLNPARRPAQLAAFNKRTEILWFGFEGAFEEPGTATIRFTRMDGGALGGGGTAAVNGGVISAGFDAAFVLAGLGQYETEVVVTLELSVQFLSLAHATPTLAFQAWVTKSARHFCFAQGRLTDLADPDARPFATASAMLAPVLP